MTSTPSDAARGDTAVEAPAQVAAPDEALRRSEERYALAARGPAQHVGRDEQRGEEEREREERPEDGDVIDEQMQVNAGHVERREA